jgi:hypothetical protein
MSDDQKRHLSFVASGRGGATTPTLGDIAKQLLVLKQSGVSLGSIEYVVNQVWWDEVDERKIAARELSREARDLLAKEWMDLGADEENARDE